MFWTPPIQYHEHDMVASIGKCDEIPQPQIQSRRCEIIIGRIDRCIMSVNFLMCQVMQTFQMLRLPDLERDTVAVFNVPEILKRFSDTSEKLLTHTIRRKGAFFYICH